MVFLPCLGQTTGYASVSLYRIRTAYINSDAFINIADYNSLDNFVADVKRIDNDAEAYLKILSAPKLLSDRTID